MTDDTGGFSLAPPSPDDQTPDTGGFSLQPPKEQLQPPSLAAASPAPSQTVKGKPSVESDSEQSLKNIAGGDPDKTLAEIGGAEAVPSDKWYPGKPQEYPGLVQRMQQIGVGSAIEEIPHQIADWWKSTPSVTDQHFAIQNKLSEMYDASPEKAAGIPQYTWLARNKEADQLMLSDPIYYGMSPGEGFARSPIPGIRGTPTIGPMIENAAKAETDLAAKTKAADVVSRRLGQDIEGTDQTPSNIASRLDSAKAAGQPLTIMDVGGPNIKALAGNIYRQPGPAKGEINQFLTERAAQAPQRIADQIQKGIASGSVYDTMENLTQSRSENAAPLYSDYFSANKQIDDPVINKILDTDIGKQALSYARRRMNAKMSLMATPDPDLTEAAKEAADLELMQPHGSGVGGARGLKGQTLDYVKQGMDDLYDANKVKDPGLAKDVKNLKNGLLGRMDALDETAETDKAGKIVTPGKYKQGRQAWSGPSQSMEALENGQDFMNQDPKEIQATVGKMSPNDREFYKLGASQTLRKNPNVLKKLMPRMQAFGDTTLRQQLRPLFDSDKSFENWTGNVANEYAMFDTPGKVMGGSPTAERLSEDRTSPAMSAVRGTVHAALGHPVSALMHFWRMKRDLGMRPDPLLNHEIAQILLDENRSVYLSPQGTQVAPTNFNELPNGNQEIPENP
jgi:hypothetical protein